MIVRIYFLLSHLPPDRSEIKINATAIHENAV
jgi:hypothetical protein